jgi:hypothetical protein
VTPIAAIMPSGGWRVMWNPGLTAAWSEPLLGWALTGDGHVIPMAAGNTAGNAILLYPGTTVAGWKFEIYHPETIGMPVPVGHHAVIDKLRRDAEQDDAEETIDKLRREMDEGPS